MSKSICITLVQVVASPQLLPSPDGKGVVRAGVQLGGSTGGSGNARVAITGGTGGLGLLVAGALKGKENCVGNATHSASIKESRTQCACMCSAGKKSKTAWTIQHSKLHEQCNALQLHTLQTA